MSGRSKAFDFAAYDALSAEQLKLGRFQPWIGQSFAEGAKRVVSPSAASGGFQHGRCWRARLPTRCDAAASLAKASPVPSAATMALEMIGPMPGMLVSRSHPASRFSSSSISPDNPSIRASSSSKSTANSLMIRSMRGESVSDGVARMRGSSDNASRHRCGKHHRRRIGCDSEAALSMLFCGETKPRTYLSTSRHLFPRRYSPR